MLIERISNPWYRFKLLHSTLEGEEEKSRSAKEAFLYVIYHYNAFNFQKAKVLDEIAEVYPEITAAVNDEEIRDHFKSFCEEAQRRNEIVSPAELTWVNKFVRTDTIRTEIEKMIYRVVLRAGSHWLKMRQDFGWTISDYEKLELVREILQDEGVGNKKKMELAEEFGEPADDFARLYYRKLLYDRHYDKAAELGVSDDETVINVIIACINNGYFQDAIDIAKRFLPQRKDLVVEIQQIIDAFNF